MFKGRSGQAHLAARPGETFQPPFGWRKPTVVGARENACLFLGPEQQGDVKVVIRAARPAPGLVGACIIFGPS